VRNTDDRRWNLADGLPPDDAATVAEFALRLAAGMTQPHAVSKIEVLGADSVFVETEATVHGTPYGMNHTFRKEDGVWAIVSTSRTGWCRLAAQPVRSSKLPLSPDGSLLRGGSAGAFGSEVSAAPGSGGASQGRRPSASRSAVS